MAITGSHPKSLTNATERLVCQYARKLSIYRYWSELNNRKLWLVFFCNVQSCHRILLLLLYIHHPHLYMYVYTIIYPPIIESGRAHRNEFTSAIRFRCCGWFISYVKGRTNETNRLKTLFFLLSENRTMKSWQNRVNIKSFFCIDIYVSEVHRKTWL